MYGVIGGMSLCLAMYAGARARKDFEKGASSSAWHTIFIYGMMLLFCTMTIVGLKGSAVVAIGVGAAGIASAFLGGFPRWTSLANYLMMTVSAVALLVGIFVNINLIWMTAVYGLMISCGFGIQFGGGFWE